jgi:hypothetical protein
MRAAADKDPGNSKSISSFAVLQDSSSEILLSVAKDSCVVFPSAAGSPLEVLSLIRAKELAQAELALARHKIEAQFAMEKEVAEAVKLAERAAEDGEAPPVPEGSGTGDPGTQGPKKCKEGGYPGNKTTNPPITG